MGVSGRRPVAGTPTEGEPTVGRFTTRTRRATTDGPGARRELSSELLAAPPPHFEAVGESLASGSGAVVACEIAGVALARDGLSLGEALDGLAATTRQVCGTDPELAHVRALAVAWSDAMLGYLNGLSCEDPLTGLATLAHLRSRIADLYRGGRSAGAGVRESHALVVVAAPSRTGRAAGQEDVLTRAMRVAQLGETVRGVFSGPEAIGHVSPDRVVVLAGREQIGRRVGLLRRMLDDGAAPRPRVWIEGLPDTDAAARALLDELARA